MRGKVAEINPARIAVEAGGIAYSINISLNTYSKLNDKNEVKVYVHLAVREDAHVLYGFAEKNERDLFRNLISVNGVGAGTAIMMLSSLSYDEIVAAVATENITALKSVKGIGIKTAQRIVIDLKDKLGKYQENTHSLFITDSPVRNEALSALLMLGFAKKDTENVVSKIIQEQPGITVENVIKQALKRM
ncbi:MAG: Holliday junction branch migration protein RuvA [Bacteroidales bacterium]|nr:Holliday junction branch migration protein RuvA [Bacteroidales bacterium]